MPEGTLSSTECLTLKADFDKLAPSMQSKEYDFNNQQFHALHDLINIAVEQESTLYLK